MLQYSLPDVEDSSSQLEIILQSFIEFTLYQDFQTYRLPSNSAMEEYKNDDASKIELLQGSILIFYHHQFNHFIKNDNTFGLIFSPEKIVEAESPILGC